MSGAAFDPKAAARTFRRALGRLLLYALAFALLIISVGSAGGR